MLKKVAAAALAVLGLATVATPSAPALAAEGATPIGAHAFSFTAIDGKPMPLADYRGKAVLVVNTASFCGFTPQYQQLQALWTTYRDRGLVVIGVPSNDFGQQEPGSTKEIKDFCEVNYRIDFPLTEKVAVTGDAAHPFYRWAGEQLGPLAKPRWNFHKYLIDGEGRLVDWFSSITEPSAVRVTRAVEAVLPRP